MAKQIARLLRSELTVSDELSKIAKLLQSKGRGKDTILAHITPKEAQLLKERGGAGTRNPETGLLEFYDLSYEGGGYDIPEPQAEPVAEPQAPIEAAPQAAEVGGPDYFRGLADAAPQQLDQRFVQASLPPAPSRSVSFGQQPGVTTTTGEQLGAAGPELAANIPPVKTTAAPKEFTDKLKDYLSDPANLAKLGLGIGGAGLGAMRARQGAKQIQAATEEQKALGAPYQTQGRELVRAAQAGELTPTSSQAYQAMQAQLAQSTATRGGVGTAQAAAQLEAFRQQLLQNQYTYGLQVANIGDQYVSGAIRTGLQLDQQLQQATSNFYTNLAAVAGGLPVARTTTTA